MNPQDEQRTVQEKTWKNGWWSYNRKSLAIGIIITTIKMRINIWVEEQALKSELEGACEEIFRIHRDNSLEYKESWDRRHGKERPNILWSLDTFSTFLLPFFYSSCVFSLIYFPLVTSVTLDRIWNGLKYTISLDFPINLCVS